MILAKNTKYLWIAGVTSLFILFYFIFDPVKYGWMPQCFFHKVTGLQCMGCGSQRVMHSLLHGDIAGAFRANALLVISLPFLLFLIWIEIYRTKYPSLYRKIHSLTLIITVSAILIAWLIMRNIFNI